MTKIILATSSQSRQEAFRLLDLEFTAQGSDVEEYFKGRPDSPEELVLHLAKLKAESVAKHYDSGIIMGFDSVGWFNRQILEKPKSRNEAYIRLKSLSGSVYQFYTGICMINLESGKKITKVAITDVQMRNLTDSEINKYLDQDSRFNTFASGYDPLENYSSTFVRKIEGSYNNLTRGIPLETIVEMLPDVGYKL
ncbi:MAG: Maf family protein [Nanoarchaeota archaeon]|nr:Maf family protein [Nanoarchaeota archaeon]